MGHPKVLFLLIVSSAVLASPGPQAALGAAPTAPGMGDMMLNLDSHAPLAGVLGTAPDFNGANAVTLPNSIDHAELTTMAWIYYTGGWSINSILGNKVGGCSVGCNDRDV
ncbi:MAG: hypothetical protein H5T69_06145 [Chloroflexi bacterium]|nr:hypothetical protein [Chloroflexota bacterium]